MFDTLDEGNFVLFAAKYYESAKCADQLEFEEDLERIKYIKKLLRKYKVTGELRERLILNHLIILYNVFYHKACTRMLCFKLYEYLDCVKPFLVYLNYWPEKVEAIGFNKEIIVDSDISMDVNVINILRNI